MDLNKQSESWAEDISIRWVLHRLLIYALAALGGAGLAVVGAWVYASLT